MKEITMKINSFCELRSLEVKFPCEITGKNGCGKSTIKRAFEFLMLMKDSKTGKEFDSSIYTENPKFAADLVADVELTIDGLMLQRISTPSQQQLNDFENCESFSVQNKYKINGSIVTAVKYAAKIAELCGVHNSSNVLDVNYFFNLSVKEKREFFLSLVNAGECAEKDELKIVREKIREKQRDIEIKNAIIQENNMEIAKNQSLIEETYGNKAANIEIAKKLIGEKRQDIEKLYNTIKENSAVLTEEEINHNNVINEQIEALKMQVFTKKAPILVKNETKSTENEKRLLEDTKVQIQKMHLYEYSADKSIVNEIAKLEKELANVQYIIENYDDLFESEKCIRCEVCTSENCSKKKYNIKLCGEYHHEADMLRMKIKKYDDILESDKAVFEAAKKDKIDFLEEKLKSYKEYINEIEESNAKIEAQNAENARIYEEELKVYMSTIDNEIAQFEAKKAAKIAELESKLITPKFVDHTELEKEIEKQNVNLKSFVATLELLEDAQKKHLNLKSIIAERYKNSEKQQEIIDLLQKDLFRNKELEVYYNERVNEFYKNIERVLNDTIPAIFHVDLFEKNITTGEYRDSFRMTFNGNEHHSNANEIFMKVVFLKWMQTRLHVDLPIFVDEFANVVNEDLRFKIMDMGCCVISPKENQNLTIISR